MGRTVRLIALATSWLMLGSVPAFAGRIVLTGHDDDFHQSAQALAAMTAFLTYVRATAPNPTLPVLTFDHGTELTSLLTALGVSFTNVDPNAGVPAASNFDVTKYSAMIVASDQSCGGCDNDSTSSTNLAGAASDIAAFFNAGGGIIGLAAAENGAYYAFLPASATTPGIVFCDTCFSQTAAGAAAGLPAVNGDFPHNFFNTPGTGGVDPLYQVFETYTGPSTAGDLTNQPFGLFFEGKIGGGGLGGGSAKVPAPALSLPTAGALALLLVGAGVSRVRRRARV